jgi:hypothetical protein
MKDMMMMMMMFVSWIQIRDLLGVMLCGGLSGS